MKTLLWVSVIFISVMAYAQDNNSLVKIPPAASIHKPMGKSQNIVVDTDIAPSSQNTTPGVVNRRVPQPVPVGPLSAADRKLAEDIQSNLVQNNLGGSVYVSCSGGVVTLQGTVTSMSKASEAEKIARSFPGVKQVIVNITVSN